MPLPLEAVPNFSEGRDPAVVERDRRRARRARGAPRRAQRPDHNRSVFTLVAGDREIVNALLAGIACARERIDLRSHAGVHPRIGAADVVPIVPVRPEDAGRARAAALELAPRVGTEIGLPVFLYAEVGDGRGPAFFRRGGTDELQRRIDAGELEPDFGPTARSGCGRGDRRHAPAADRVQRQPRRRESRGGAGDRAASYVSATAASPACEHSVSTCPRPVRRRSA